jgi:hypothetical protein
MNVTCVIVVKKKKCNMCSITTDTVSLGNRQCNMCSITLDRFQYSTYGRKSNQMFSRGSSGEEHSFPRLSLVLQL